MKRYLLPAIANPGANSSVVIYDDNESGRQWTEPPMRIHTMAFLDQAFSLDVWWAENETAPLRLIESDTYTPGSGGFVAPVRATQPITAVTKAELVNNDYFTVVLTVTRNGVVESTTTKIFEYKVDGDFVATAGRTTIDVSALTTDVQVAVATAAAVVTAFAGALQAATPTTAVLTLKSVVSGTSYAVTATENVADSTFAIGTATAGVDGSIIRHNVMLGPGRFKIVLDTGTAPTEFSVRSESYSSSYPGF